MLNKKTILITGVAGFIGYHTALKFLNNDYKVIGIDIFDPYYDIKLKKNRIKDIKKKYKNFIFFQRDIKNLKSIEPIFKKNKIDVVINLAANPGIRASIENPLKIFNNNISGFFQILLLLKKYKIKKLLFASTSSAYGNLNKKSYVENDLNNTPLQMYSASKVTNEVMAHVFSNLYNIKCIGLRFFTVFGPWGRPDMAYFKFVNHIKNNQSIKIFNYGNHKRDFTYVDDITDGIFLAHLKINNIFKKKAIPFEILNLGNTNSVSIIRLVKTLEKKLSKKAKIKFVKKQDGDMLNTKSNINRAKKLLNYYPKISFDEGIKKFLDWHNFYYK